MRARLYLEGYVDVELDSRVAQMVCVRDGVLAPTDQNYESTFGTLVCMMLLDDVDQVERERYSLEPTAWSTICRVCGCTEEEACPSGCCWVEADLCSTCAQLSDPVPS